MYGVMNRRMAASVRARALGSSMCVGVMLFVWIAAGAQEIAPTIVVETSRGSFSFETFPGEAPLTVAHIVDLVKSGFYDGQRVHRALPGFLVQFGDPQTRDLAKREVWGKGQSASSGKPVGVAEITAKRTHAIGAVGIAHQGEPAKADSQIYVTLAARRDLDGQYAVFGQIVDGDEVPAMLQVGDSIIRMYVKP
jgi:cyclophilin family peptidyl-prolyl cis-trans isomerase